MAMSLYGYMAMIARWLKILIARRMRDGSWLMAHGSWPREGLCPGAFSWPRAMGLWRLLSYLAISGYLVVRYWAMGGRRTSKFSPHSGIHVFGRSLFTVPNKISQLTRPSLVKLVFFMCHIRRSIMEQLSGLHTEKNVPGLLKIIGRT